MPPNPGTLGVGKSIAETVMRRVLGSLSFFTMVMTVPQVLSIWIGHQAAGVSIISWSAYLISAAVWFWYGLRRHEPNIYLACIGWMALDVAVIVGTFLYR